MKIDFEPDQASSEAKSFLKFLFEDFFVSAHRTGLYNRQPKLWEAVAKIVSGKIETLSTGWFLSKQPRPVDELLLYDSLERPLILAWLVKEIEEDSHRELTGYLNQLVKKVNKLKLQESLLTGLFFSCPHPVEQAFVDRVLKLVGADDPSTKSVALYDSRLPEPALIPLDLVSYGESQEEESEQQSDQQTDEPSDDQSIGKTRLIHPLIEKYSKSK